jgi:hypothetical protein
VIEENRKLNAQAEIEASAEALSAAQTLLATGLLRSAVSRLYYAMLHLVRALLVRRGFDPRTHEGVETLFGLHFVRTGIVDVRFGKLFAHLQKFREQADYGPMLALNAGEVERDVDGVKEFVDEVGRLLEING